MLKAGQLIDRYELVCPIGDGGMASVWAARREGAKPGMTELVALKLIHSRFAEDPAFRAMFLDEANIVAAIEHPNVAKVYEHVESLDHLYLVMEYVDGDSLFSLVSQFRTAPLAIALHVVAQACAGLHAAHSLVGPDGQPRHVVHRDVSPQNILLSVTGDTRLIDFGIAHARDRSAQATALGTIKGKIRYMAPEQARREPIGPWTDVFGIGATLFRLLSGRAPYSADTDLTTMQALLAGAPALQPLPADLPPDVVSVIQQAIAPSVDERFRSADALRRALQGLLEENGGRPDVAEWVASRMTEAARQRRMILDGSAPAPAAPAMPPGLELAGPTARPPSAPDVPELAPAMKRTPRGTALMAPMPELASPAIPQLPPGASIKSTALMPTKPEAPTRPDGKRGPLPPPPDAPGDPGFMDVRAIVQNARVPDLPVPAPRAAGGQPRSAPAKEQHLRLELKYEPSNRTAAPPPKSNAVRIAIAVISAVILVALFTFAVPMIVKSRAIAAGREAGFEMTIDRVGVGLGTATFRGVKMKAIHVPGVTADVAELFVSGFSMKEIRLIGMRAALDGAPADFEMGLGLLLSENRVRFAGTPQAPRKLLVVGGRVVWKGPGGAGFEATELGLEAESRGNGNEDARASASRITYRSATSTLGPWAGSLDTSPANTRLRVALDPALPDGPSVLITSSPTAPAKVTVKVARSPLANLGLKPAELGLPADGSTEIETFLEGEVAADGKMSIVGPTSLWGLRVKDVKKPLDLKIEGGLVGVLGKPLDIDRMLVSFGPFTAVVTGTVTPEKGNVRVDALVKANAVPCEKLARMEAKTMGSFAQMLQAFGESTGVLRVRGEVNASCAVKYDTADPDGTSVTWLARETCGLSIFGL